MCSIFISFFIICLFSSCDFFIFIALFLIVCSFFPLNTPSIVFCYLIVFLILSLYSLPIPPSLYLSLSLSLSYLISISFLSFYLNAFSASFSVHDFHFNVPTLLYIFFLPNHFCFFRCLVFSSSVSVILLHSTVSFVSNLISFLSLSPHFYSKTSMIAL